MTLKEEPIVENHKQFDIVCAGIATWDTLFSGIDRDLMSIDGILSKGYTASSGGDAVNAAISTGDDILSIISFMASFDIIKGLSLKIESGMSNSSFVFGLLSL